MGTEMDRKYRFLQVNEYLYAIEGINVLRRSGKEVERLLSMFDKCTVYTIYNRDDFSHLSTPPNEMTGKQEFCSVKSFSSSLTDYGSSRSSLLTTVTSQPFNPIHQQQALTSQVISCSSSPSSSIDGSSSCSISPKHLQQYSITKKGPFSKHLQFFRLTSRSCSNTLK